MNWKFKRWEVALLIGILVTAAAGNWIGREQQELAAGVIRLHVIANSDTGEDQALKLAVRDRVLDVAGGIYPEHAGVEQARRALTKNLSALAEAGSEVVRAWGYDYPVTAQLTQSWFPTKEYDDFALPAGNYTALRITIGQGEGQNWWCVAFPPLCMGAASQTVEEAAQVGNFTPGQVKLITETNQGYVLKFKSMELLGNLKGLFSR